VAAQKMKVMLGVVLKYLAAVLVALEPMHAEVRVRAQRVTAKV
jgi:hypothetical protein